jgi:hypothetical protein
LVFIPIIFGLLIPKTYTGFLCFFCCKRRSEKVEVFDENQSNRAEDGAEKAKEKKMKNSAEKLSMIMVYFINTISVLLSMGFFFLVVVVHGC